MKKNDEIEVLIEGYTSEGHGVAKPDGFVLFIPSTIKGERVIAHVTKVNKNFGYAKAIKILTPSSERVQSLCAVSTTCGGCALHHMNYKEELSFKKQKVENNLKKAGINHPVDDVVPSEDICRYRNKAQYPIRNQGGRTVGGFYRQNSHTVIEGDCLIQPEIFNKILQKTVEFMESNKLPAYDEVSLRGIVRHLYLRSSENQQSIMVCLVVTKSFDQKYKYAKFITDNFENVSTVLLCYNDKNTNVVLGRNYELLYGKGYIKDTLLGCSFEISPESFYQVNRKGCEKLYSIVKDHVKDSENLLDLYCGIGTIGICTSGKDTHLTGVEIVEKAIENAKKNALANGITNAVFKASDASFVKELVSGGFDTIIVDPPRKGCDRQTLDFLIESKPERLVYVSCDSATLARDLKILTDGGFEIKKITPVDMFPKTAHCECVVRLDYKKFRS